jgi:signal transduction histidine kinase
MNGRRSAGTRDHAVESVIPQPNPSALHLYPEILRGLPLGVVVLHLENPSDVKSLRIIDLNPAAAEMTGWTMEDLRGRTLAEFPKFLKAPFLGQCLAAFRSGEARNLGEISFGDERVPQDTYVVQVFPLSENCLGVAIENVTERKRAEQALLESAARFRLLIEGAQERLEKEESLKRAKELLELRVEQRTAVLDRVYQELRTEIFDRHRAEEQLRMSLEQLRALAARLQQAREEERTRVAREIHDELGQACTALKMDLALAGSKATKRQTQIRAKINSATQLVDNLIISLRRIGSELRPSTLDDLGLNATLEWQAQEFERHTGVPCSVALPPEPLALDSERSTAIFRIFQESLTNVARHADATRVEARLEKEGDQLILQVRDNGKGFDAEEAKGRRSLGLVGMQERALLLNGEVKIEGVPGAGTTMTLRIPLPPLSLPKKAS